MPTPKPGRPVRGSRSGRPIMAALDLLGRRWALGVVWSLRDEPRSFGAIQAELDGISSSVLTDRLRELQDAGVATTNPAGHYELTATGTRLIEALTPLHDWANDWARREARRRT